MQIKSADWFVDSKPSLLYRLARRFGSDGELISLAGGMPDLGLCPREELIEATQKAMVHQPRSLQYNRDLTSLKAQIVELMKLRGVDCSVGNITMSASGQHGMDMVTRLLLNPAGTVMLEELVYTGIQQTVMPLRANVLTIPIDPDTGLDVDTVEKHLRDGVRPAFLYTICEAHNPVGVSTSLAKRERLVALARHYQVPIVEDDAYGFLQYDDSLTPALYSLDPNWVIYLGTFSKILAPGFRLGWIVSPASVTPQLRLLKRLSALCVAPLSQHIINTYLEDNDFAAHLTHIRAGYRQRRDGMLQAMDDFFPAGLRWNKPRGGMFVWAGLPAGYDSADLVERIATEAKIGYIPAKAFIVNNKDYTTHAPFMRLTFSRAQPEQLRQAIKQLGTFLTNFLEGD